MDATEWDVALRKAGFSGVDVDIRGDRQESKEPVSLIISTTPIAALPTLPTLVIVSTGTERSDDLATSIQNAFASAGHKSTIVDWNSTTKADFTDRYCICLAEWETPILADLTDFNWDKLHEVILSSTGTLWITGGGSMDTPQPMKSLMVGLARAIRNEYSGTRLAVLDLNPPESQKLDQSVTAVLKVALSHMQGDGADGEFAARDGTVFVPRVERLLNVDSSLRKYEAKGEVSHSPPYIVVEFAFLEGWRLSENIFLSHEA